MVNLPAGLLSSFPLPVILIVGPVMGAAGLIPLGRVHGMSLLPGFDGWL